VTPLLSEGVNGMPNYCRSLLSGLLIIVQLLGAEEMEVSGDDDDTGGNETEDDGSEGNLITGLFAGSLSEAIVNFFGGIIDWFTSLF
jgi:hypothetical protein